ncbi:MAG: SDR family oxidoreductase, partial [Acidimicrobiia bacterium]|nr:SDR family oxidoreductase [Acidimicrobiia bacterium]
KSDFDLTGRDSVVTGALGLLGREHCAALSAAGATVIAADLDGEAAAAFARSLPGASGAPLDVTDPGSLEALRSQLLAEHGRIDVLVNNAAVNDMFEDPAMAAEQSMFEHYPLEQWERSLAVNVTGVFLASQVLGTPMAEAGSGSIINVASTYGLVGPDQRIYVAPDGTQAMHKSPSYPATKGAVVNFTRFLAAYWGHRGVRVNTLSPGGVENGQDEWFVDNYADRTQLGRMAMPDDYHGAIVFLASDASKYMTGANLVVDGGWTAW